MNELNWCYNHLIDNYLDANENTVLKAIRKDTPIPKEIIELLIKYEKEKLNRFKIIKILKEMKRKIIVEELKRKPFDKTKRAWFKKRYRYDEKR